MRCTNIHCEFFRHTDIKNNGGTHCCRACKSEKGHGPACQKNQILIQPRFASYRKINFKPSINNRAWFLTTELSKIYNFPPLKTDEPNVVVGVISFGGGLYGNVSDSGVLTDSDIQKYWTSIGIPLNKQPKVIIVTVGNAKNNPDINDGGLTYENTLDVETIGGCYPSPNLTIVLYITLNSISNFAPVIDYAASDTKNNPTILSISWGSPEINFSGMQLDSINTALFNATSKGIIICTATGDYGSSNGTHLAKCADFPSSSPYSTAIGGTNLVSSLRTSYNSETVEKAWSNGGGAVSRHFRKPPYQRVKIGDRPIVPGKMRSIPDISSNSDPNTGVVYYVGGLKGEYYLFGGTSVAAPTIAAYFASVNKKGFVNPKLYRAPLNCFHDIKNGSNGGYRASLGYDNCTGRGSIDGLKLSKYL